MFGALLWQFFPAFIKITLKVGFICPFVVIDPTDLGATIVVAQALCLTIFNLSLTQNTCLFTDGNKASVCASAAPSPAATATAAAPSAAAAALLLPPPPRSLRGAEGERRWAATDGERHRAAEDGE